MTLQDIFGPRAQMTWPQECARAALILIYGLALVRIAGLRVFGKWAALDIVVSIVICSNLSRALTGSAALWGTLAAATLVMLLHWVLSLAAAHSSRLSHVLDGRPIRLGENGHVNERTLTQHAVSEAELREALRTAGPDDVSGTRIIALEPSGRIAVLKAGG